MWSELTACSSLCLIEPHIRNLSLTLKPTERFLSCEALPDMWGWVLAHLSLLQWWLITWVFLHWTLFHLFIVIYITQTLGVWWRWKYGNYFTCTSHLWKPALLTTLLSSLMWLVRIIDSFHILKLTCLPWCPCSHQNRHLKSKSYLLLLILTVLYLFSNFIEHPVCRRHLTVPLRETENCVRCFC